MNETHKVDLLLVEDNPEELELALRALKKINLGDHIAVVRDGEEAQDFIFCTGPHAARNSADGPKLILLDLKLPKVDGLEVLKRIKSDPHSPSDVRGWVPLENQPAFFAAFNIQPTDKMYNPPEKRIVIW